MSSSGSILVWTPICKAEGKGERSSLLPCFPVLPSPAGPCSLGCWSASHFHSPVLKGPLQLVGLVPAPAVGSVAGRCWGAASAHTLQILRLHVGARGGGCFPHALVGALARCRHGCPSARQMGGTRGAASCSASSCCPPVHSPAHQVAGLPAMPVAVCGCLFPQAWVEAARQLEGLLRHLDWRLYSAKFYQLLG